MPHSFYDGKTILITGASSGIGREMARLLAPRARSLWLIARRLERLEELRSELRLANPALEVLIFPCDMGDLEAVRRFADALDAEGKTRTLDILVNNAGVGLGKLFTRSPWEKIDSLLRVNILGLTYLTHRLLPALLARPHSGLLNVSSGFGYTILPGYAVYSASKHYVSAWTETLQIELQNTSMRVTQLCPGPVATEFESVAGTPVPGANVPLTLMQDAGKCARNGLLALARGKKRHFASFTMLLLFWIDRVTPRVVLRLLSLPMLKRLG